MKIFLLFNFFNIVFISAQIQNTFNTIIESGEVVQKKSHKNIVSLSKLNKADKMAENSSSLISVSPQIRTSYRPSTIQNTTSRNAQWCGTMPQWELNNPDQRSCNLFGTTDDPNIRNSFIPEVNDGIIYIRLIVHGFADDNGNNPTTTIEDVEAQIFTLNEAFINHKIQFVAWFQTHNSSESQILSSADWASGNIKEVFSVDPLSYHNIYVVDTDSDFGILGVSTFPWDSDALTIYGGTLIDKDWFGGPRYFNNLNNVPQKTIVHELGHALGLWHTQHGVGEVEECGPCYEGADGYQYSGNDNEDIVGDLCSDTKGTVINYACSDPEGNDCQGNSWNNTDFHNYMGYADDDCYNLNNQGFTAQQSGRLHGWIMDKYEGLIVNKTENLLISTSFEENGLPSGWFAYDGDADGNTWSIGSDLLNPGFDIAYFGNNGAMLFTGGSSSNNDYLISPLIDIPSDANNCNLSFWGTSHNPSYLDDFVIKISTDGSTFNSLGVVYNTPSNWTSYSIDLNDYLGQSVYLAIQGISSSGHYLFIDDFVVSIDNEDLPLISDFSSDFTSGPLPLDVSFTDLSSGSPNSWQWFFGDGSSSQEQNPIHTYTTPGLYTVTLEITKDDETDLEIKTNHIAVGNILSQDFSSGIPSDWSILNVNNDNINWQVFSESSSSGADIAHSGNLSVGIHYNTNGNNDWLITNSLVLPDNNNITFSLWARSFDPIALEDFNVLVSSSSNNSLSDFNSISNTTNVPNNWTQYFYDISNFSGDTVFIAIQSVSVNAWYLFVDDFFINNEPIYAGPVWHVSNSGSDTNDGSQSSPFSNIRSALNAAGTGDTVLVQPGTYTENIIWPETNGIKLISAGDSSNTIIDGGGVSSVIYMNPQTATIDTTTQIEGFKITNGGNVPNGGGIFIGNDVILKLKKAHINENISNNFGGGVFIIDDNNSGIYIEDSRVSENHAEYGGGGMFLEYDGIGAGFFHILRTTFTNNSITLGYGAGIGFSGYGLNATINLSYFAENINPGYDGGAIYFGNGTINIDSSIFKNNMSNGGGGAISGDGTLIINNSEFENNISNGAGGAINSNFLNAENTKFISNYSYSEGGGVKIGRGGILKNNIFFQNKIIHDASDNTAGGGAIWSTVNNSNLLIENCQFVENYSPSGIADDIYFYTLYGNNSSANIINSSFIGRSSFGDNSIYVRFNNGNQVNVESSNFIFGENSIYNNDNSSFVQATNNYWGSSFGPYHPSQNPSGEGDSVNIFVNVDPWLTAPNSDAPPIPAQNVTITSTGNDFISLSWDASELGDLAGYKLYFDTDSSGYPYGNSIDVGNVASYSLSNLALGTTYYLAITTYDTDGNESWFSNEVVGVTRILGVQDLTIGVSEDRMHIIDHAPMISFDYYDSMGEEQTSYQIQVSVDSLSITPGDIWESGIVNSDTTNVQYAGNELMDGNMYYLRVRAASGDFWSNWNHLSFRMNSKPTVPILVSPINNQVTTTPTILSVLNSADAEDDNITYSFNVFEDATMETRLDSVIGIPPGQDTTKWQIGFSLPDNGQYFWNVTANDGFENSNLSEVGSFLLNTDNNPPDLFSLSMPMVNTSVQTLSPVFSWQVANDPDPVDTIKYRLLLDTPAPGVEVYEIGTDTSFVIPNQLLDNTQYFWQVIASDLLGFQTSNEGGYQTFFVNISNDPPTLSTLIAPLQGSIQTDIRPNFYWSEANDPDPFDHVIYSIEWWPINETDVMFIEDVDTNTFTPEYDLSDNSKFGWRVTVKDIEGLSSMTDSSYFFTDAFPEPPLAFSTVYPENNAQGLGTSIDFVWNKTIDPDPLDEVSYQLVYGTDWQDSSTYVFSDITIDTSISILVDNNNQYYWIVVARDADGFIVGSNNDTPNMVTVGTLSVDNNTVPTVFALHQNYPNPFNPTTKISYDLPKNEFVSISIYDVMGRKMKSLINSMQEAGYRSITWDATNDLGQPISAGMYIYTIQAGEFRQTRKMVLLK
jgi:PKD repeat protein